MSRRRDVKADDRIGDGPRIQEVEEDDDDDDGKLKYTEPFQLFSQKRELAFSPLIAYLLIVTVRFLSVDLAVLADCDEVFNYWEPTHYLSHGFGLQTWEYSPAYAIRSWAYTGLHAIISRLAVRLLGNFKLQEFFFLRAVFALFCSFCELRLYRAISLNISSEVGSVFIILSATSAGMFNGAVSYLPSTFAMYFAMLGIASFIQTPQKPSKGIFWFAVGGILGWPFSLALAIPFILDVVLRGQSSLVASRILSMVKGIFSSLIFLATIVGIDSYAYGKLSIVPLNIVLYNVFGGSGKGPDLYGTEPWWFYIANLLLNFNIVLLMALACGPVIILGTIPVGASLIAPVSAFYVWLAIFSAQPHKEERFMFVAYPALCLNAALTFSFVNSYLRAGELYAKSYSQIFQIGKFLLLLTIPISAMLSLSRTVAVTSSYNAPIHILAQQNQNITGNVCYGKEWYRFPSSYFLPSSARAKFIKSAFSGLLPGEFVEGQSWDRPGIWTLPENMNDENKEDMSKYIDISKCDYLVDSYFQKSSDEKYNEESLEPDYVLNDKEWSRVHCEKFLDAGKTPFFGRAFNIPSPDRRVWGEYCLLRRKNKDEKEG